MAETFKRSWDITKVTFSILRDNKSLIWFPTLAFILSAIFSLTMIGSTILIKYTDSSVAGVPEVPSYIILFLTYLGLSFISTFFNFAVVHSAKKIFEHKEASFSDSMRYTLSKIHLVFIWSLVVAVVGLLFKILERLAKQMKEAGKIILLLTRAILGIAWSIATIFVIQSMVYNETKPIDSIRDSISTFRKTWGETMVRAFGLGAVEFALIMGGLFLGMIVFFTAMFFSISQGSLALGLTLMIAVGVLIGLYLLGVIMVFSVANSIFNTAIYIYAKTGKVPGYYSIETLSKAFEKTGKVGE